MTEALQRQHEQIQMQVNKHIPRYPNPLIFAFLYFKKPEAKTCHVHFYLTPLECRQIGISFVFLQFLVPCV